MAEPPAKPKSRARYAPPPLSLFEWAVAVEQSQEAEKVKVAVPAWLLPRSCLSGERLEADLPKQPLTVREREG